MIWPPTCQTYIKYKVPIKLTVYYVLYLNDFSIVAGEMELASINFTSFFRKERKFTLGNIIRLLCIVRKAVGCALCVIWTCCNILQHGFLTGKSCTTQLVCSTTSIFCYTWVNKYIWSLWTCLRTLDYTKQYQWIFTHWFSSFVNFHPQSVTILGVISTENYNQSNPVPSLCKWPMYLTLLLCMLTTPRSDLLQRTELK